MSSKTSSLLQNVKLSEMGRLKLQLPFTNEPRYMENNLTLEVESYTTLHRHSRPDPQLCQLWQITIIKSFSCCNWWSPIHLIPLSFTPKASLHHLSLCSLKSFNTLSSLALFSPAFLLLSSPFMLLGLISLSCCLSLHLWRHFWERPLVRVSLSTWWLKEGPADWVVLSLSLSHSIETKQAEIWEYYKYDKIHIQVSISEKLFFLWWIKTWHKMSVAIITLKQNF